MARVVVVGLGPGNPDLVTAGTLERIRSLPHRYLRTARHPSAHLVPGARTFDDVYEGAPSFDDVYGRIVDALVTAARRHGEVLYAVPGSPLVLERTVALLRDTDAVEVEVLPAVSFLDEVWRVLGIDPVEAGVRLVDGHRFARDAASYEGAMVVAHTHANWVLSDIKLSVDDPDPHCPVTILHHLGLPDQQVVQTTWSEMDRSIEADHLTTLWIPHMRVPVAAEMMRFHELARTLRHQCPWDMEQTHSTLVRYLIEETYELVDAISRLDPDDPATEEDFIEELGDLLYQVEFHAAIAEQEGRFTIADVARTVHDKLVSRHPHVFGDVTVADAAEVESNWDAIKAREKPARTGIFDGVAESAPALTFAWKVQQRAAKVGFDWPNADGPMEKVTEELGEVASSVADADPEATMDEVGDLLFAVVNVARHLDVDPESALRDSIHRFRARVTAVESLAAAQGRQMSQMGLAELDELWNRAKAAERG